MGVGRPRWHQFERMDGVISKPHATPDFRKGIEKPLALRHDGLPELGRYVSKLTKGVKNCR